MNFKVYRFIFAMAFCSIVHGQSQRTSPCSESELEKIRVSSQTCLTEGLQQVDPSSDSNPYCSALDHMIKCGDLYKTCLNEKELRKQLDTQLEVLIQYLEKVDKSGIDIRSCSAVQEYQQSGRKDIVEPTEKCSSEKVKELSTKYAKCEEDGNNAMTKTLSGGRFRGEALFEAICKSVDKTLRDCGVVLTECYSTEEVEKIDSAQRELIQKLLLQATKNTPLEIDLAKCSANKS